MIKARTSLGIVVLALAGWLAYELLAGSPAAKATGSFTSSQQCAECHPSVYDEWRDSWHARSWIDPDVRALSNDFSNTDCIDCHAPRPVFETGIGKRVLPRADRRAEGVDCIACHSLPPSAGGGVAGTRANSSAACRPLVREELAEAEFCGVCHDQHATVQQWQATPYAAQGISCVDCHMPYRGGDPERGRDHRCLGGHDLALLQSAVTLAGTRTPQGWTIAVTNVGAGHHFPTDERSRAADLFWRPAAEAHGSWRFLYRIRDPYRHETDITSNLIAHGETRTVPLTEEDARGAVEVALFYKLSPYYENPAAKDPEREARLVHRILLSP